MNGFHCLLITALFFLVAGIFLLTNSLLLSVTEIFVKVWRRTFISWVGKRLRKMGILEDKPCQTKQDLNWKPLFLLLFCLFLSLAVHDLMLSPLVLLVGLLVLTWMNFYRKQVERSRINEDAESVALQIRSLMSVDHSLVNALLKIQLSPGKMKEAMEQITSRLRMQQPPEKAVIALQGLPGTITSRLAALIARSAQLTDAVQESLLRSLEEEVHRQKLFRSKTRQTLSLVRGTVRLLQGVVCASISFVLLSPAWREFFLQDISHRVLLFSLVCGAVLASFFFEYEVYQLTYREV